MSCLVKTSKAHLMHIFKVVLEMAELGIESKVISVLFMMGLRAGVTGWFED